MSESIESQIPQLMMLVDRHHSPITVAELRELCNELPDTRSVDPAGNRGPTRRRLWIGAVAASLLLLLVGSLPLLNSTSGTEPATTTPPLEPTPATTVPTPTTEAPESVDLEVLPLEFSQFEAPWSGYAWDGKWVHDRFVVAAGSDLYWTDNGEDWYADEEFEALGVGKPGAGDEGVALASDGTRLAVWSTRGIGQEGGQECALPGAEVVVAIRGGGGDWSTSQLTVPRPNPDDPGCVPTVAPWPESHAQAVIGPLGVLMRVKGFTWFSTGDGEWTPSDLEPSEKFPPGAAGDQFRLVAGFNAFYASSEEPEMTYRSTDGLNWEQYPVVSVFGTHPTSGIEYGTGEIGWWKGQLVQSRANGIFAFETNEPVTTDGPKTVRRYFGPMGIFGGQRGAFPPDIYTDEAAFFSPDGKSYATWKLTEFDGPVTVLGVADNYVLLAEYDQATGNQTIWTGRLVR